MNKVFLLSESELRSLYLDANMTMKQIAEYKNVSVGYVFKVLHFYNIPTKPSHSGMLGKKMSEAAKKKISQGNKGKKISDETKAKQRIAKLGRLINPSEYGGHRKTHQNGYIMVYIPNHPYATKDGYVFEHILAFEKANKCIVDRTKYCVHHINEIKKDNRPENLLLMTKKEHMSYHSKTRHLKRREQLCKNL